MHLTCCMLIETVDNQVIILLPNSISRKPLTCGMTREVVEGSQVCSRISKLRWVLGDATDTRGGWSVQETVLMCLCIMF